MLDVSTLNIHIKIHAMPLRTRSDYSDSPDPKLHLRLLILKHTFNMSFFSSYVRFCKDTTLQIEGKKKFALVDGLTIIAVKMYLRPWAAKEPVYLTERLTSATFCQ